MGADKYNAITAILDDLGVDIIMDAEIGHIDPMLPVVMGAKAKVTAKGNELKLSYVTI
jgi:muramoyltetrapeptide carboxypeptidase LdcA involved in peptidoglycan recycling